jgi:hypothetical protein
MFEWLKKIIGDTYTEEMDKLVAKEIGNLFVSKENYDKVNDDKKALVKAATDTAATHAAELKKRDDQLTDLKKVDPAALQAKIGDLEKANKDAADAHAAELGKIKLGGAITEKLRAAGAVNVKAVQALLDMTKISLDGENLLGIDEQLKTLKESEKWAFGAQQPAGSTRLPGGEPPAGGVATVGDSIKAAIFGTASNTPATK